MSEVKHSIKFIMERFARICDSDAHSVVRCQHCQTKLTRHVRIVRVRSKLKNSGIGWQVRVETHEEAVLQFQKRWAEEGP